MNVSYHCAPIMLRQEIHIDLQGKRLTEKPTKQKTYAQAAANNSYTNADSVQQDERIHQTLQIILTKLDNQESLIATFYK